MKYLLLLISIVFCYSLQGQSEVDSLRSVINGLEGNERIDVQFKLASKLVNINPIEAEELAVEMLQVSDDLDYPSGRAKAYHILGNAYNIRSKLDTAISFFEKSLAIAEKGDDYRLTGSAAVALGSSYLRKYQLNSALESFQKALTSARNTDDQALQVTSLMNIAVVHTYLKDQETAETRLSEALEISTRVGIPIRTAQIYGNLGNLEFDRSNFSLSKNHFMKALDIFRQLGASQMMSIVYTQLGRNNSELGEPERALEDFDQALSIRKQSGDQRGIASVLRYKAQSLLELRRLAECRSSLEEALLINDLVADPYISMDLVMIRYQLAELEGDFKNAFTYHKQYMIFKDTIDARNERQEVKKLTAEFNYAQLTQQLEQERQEKEIAELRKSQRGLWLLLAIIFLMGVVIIYVVNRSRLRKQLIINQQEKVLLNEQVASQASKISEIESELLSLEAEHSANAETKEELVKYLSGTKVEAKDWASFKLLFEKIYPGALSNLKQFDLTLNDQRLAALNLLGLSIKEIASVLGITPKSVSKARVRLSAKLGLSDTKELDQFISNNLKTSSSVNN